VVDDDQAFVGEPVERAVQGAGAQLHLTVGQGGDGQNDPVPVQRLRRQRGQDEKRRLLHGRQSRPGVI